MALAARGAWVAECLAAMQSRRARPRACSPTRHAMTDVTGFGLAGHLANMARASGVAAEITLDAVPFLPGAVELSARGIRSTLFEANLRHAFDAPAPSDPRAALLYDPQTAGGLLAAVAPEDAGSTLASLVDAGYAAARIGTVTAGAPSLRLA